MADLHATVEIVRPKPKCYVGRYRHRDTINPDRADLGIIGFAVLLVLGGCVAGGSVWGWLL